eukprot:GHVU01139046.1.p1 GENE.GHVU01139046.1~~GHVU01139046.1.p1  ORF type:complete len:339 (+),score=35.65 GHVU01139046.1:34-1050(+)
MKPDTIFQILTCTVVLWAVPQFRSLLPTVENRHKHRHDYPSLNELWGGLYVAFGLIASRFLLTRVIARLGESLIPTGKWSDKIRGMKKERFALACFKFFFFMFTSLFGWYNLRDKVWFPPPIGGTGTTAEYWKDYPFQETDPGIKWYFLINMGYHLSIFLYLSVDHRFPDFYEDLLRSSIGCLLISFSYLSNYLRVGSIIMFVHDFCDIFGCLCKTFVDTELKLITLSSFFVLLVSWTYLRIYCFCSLVLSPIFQDLTQVVRAEEVTGWYWLVFCIFVLFLLNIYWFLLMLKMLVYFLWSGQTDDMHSRLSDADFKDNKQSRVEDGAAKTNSKEGHGD